MEVTLNLGIADEEDGAGATASPTSKAGSNSRSALEAVPVYGSDGFTVGESILSSQPVLINTSDKSVIITPFVSNFCPILAILLSLIYYIKSAVLTFRQNLFLL